MPVSSQFLRKVSVESPQTTDLYRHNIGVCQCLSDKQHGFRKRRSCESQLIVTIDDLARCLNESGQIDAILLNLYKAFDKATLARLAKKLNHYCVRGKTLAGC